MAEVSPTARSATGSPVCNQGCRSQTELSTTSTGSRDAEAAGAFTMGRTAEVVTPNRSSCRWCWLSRAPRIRGTCSRSRRSGRPPAPGEYPVSAPSRSAGLVTAGDEYLHSHGESAKSSTGENRWVPTSRLESVALMWNGTYGLTLCRRGR